jgi:threonine/homoserine/homoserine lactone efflux protein
MSWELFFALVVFATVTLFTPGPNNVMLMTSGVNFGFSRTQAHLWGVSLGFALMVLIVGVGLGAIFTTAPLVYTILKYVSAAYLLYLAWKIATSGSVEEEKGRGRPMTFLEATAFQWVNPKGWIMAIGSVTTYAAVLSFPYNMILMAAVFGVLGTFSAAAWVGFGTGLRRFLRSPRAMRIFNLTMALALVASLVPVFFEGH